MTGWIKLYRKVLQSSMYKSLTSQQRDVLITLLLMANYEYQEWEWNGQVFECMPGQFVTSLESIKQNCAKDVSLKNIRTALVKLEKWDFLANKSAKTGRLITIINWDSYQSDEDENGKDNGSQLANRRQTGGKQAATSKNIKKVKKVKNNNIRGRFIPPSIEEVKAYCIERKNSVNPDLWFDHYTSKGWMIGKNKMKDWKAAVRTWENNTGGSNAKSRGSGNTGFTEAGKAGKTNWLS